MKAFLSHSSADKQIVSNVAKELGRQFCVYDEFSFATGEGFEESIRKGLAQSGIFVLFASHNALKSIWVDFETSEAKHLLIQKNLEKILVYIIDEEVEFHDLPEWLRRSVVRRERLPKLIARDVRYHLDEQLRVRQNPFFVGRKDDIEELEHILVPIDGSSPPHVIAVSGLPGIGRRSLIREAIPSILNIRKQVELRIGEGDNLYDVAVKLADKIEVLSTPNALKESVEKISRLSENEVLEKIIEYLRMQTAANELPVFMDEGGVVDPEGFVRAPFLSLLRRIAPNDDVYFVLVTTSKPHVPGRQDLPVIKLSKLKESDGKRLLSRLADAYKVELNAGQLSQIAEYTAGYPPAYFHAVQQVREYGVEVVLNEKRSLVEFRTSVFLRHIEGLNLLALHKQVLQLLAIHSPLPAVVLGRMLGANSEELSKVLIRLIDLALVVINDFGLYRISDPVAPAVVRAFGLPDSAQHSKIAGYLRDFLNIQDANIPMLEVSSTLFRAAWLANDLEAASQAVHLASDEIKLTESQYHARQYAEVIETAKVALKSRPNSESARNYLIRALIQQEQWAEAEEQIEEYKRFVALKHIYFLKGFLARKRRQPTKAIDLYKKAIELGRSGADVSREMALCYFLTGDLASANIHIRKALQKDIDNPYLVNLWAQIASNEHDEPEARKALERLKLLSEPMFYYHRLSRVELLFKNHVEAETAAQMAFDVSIFPTFEVLANLAMCKMLNAKYEDAESTINLIDKTYANILRDVRVTLRCHLEVFRRNFHDALSFSDRIVDKGSDYKKLMKDIFSGLLSSDSLDEKERSRYSAELKKIEEDVSRRPASIQTSVSEVDLILDDLGRDKHGNTL